MRRILLASAAAFALAACDSQTQSTTSASGAGADSAAERTVERRPARGTTSDEAVQAFYLANSGDGRVTYASMEDNGGERVFNDVMISDDDDEGLHAERLRLIGAYMDGETASFDSLVLENVSIRPVDTGSVTIESITIDEPNDRVSEVIALAFSNEDAEDWDDDRDFGKFTDYGFAGFAIHGLKIKSEENGDPVSIRIGELSFEGVGGGDIAGFSFRDFEFLGEGDNGETITGSLESLSFSGLDVSAFDAFSDLDGASDADIEKALSDSGLTNPFVKRYDNFALAGLNFDVDGVQISLDNAQSNAKQTRGGVEMTDTMGPLRVSVGESGDLGQQLKMGLDMLGYEELVIESNAVYMADELNDRIYSREASLTLQDGFTLEFDYDIGGIREYMDRAMELGGGNIDSFDDFDPDAMAEIYAPLVINKFEMSLLDDSITERGLQAAASMMGSTPEDVRDLATGFLTMGAMGVPEGPGQALVLDAIAATKEFLEQPGRLTISVDSAQPIALGELMGIEDPNELVEKLPIKIEASRN